MQPKPIYPYISFGTGIRFLQDAKENFPIHYEKGGILENIDKILRMMDQLDLKISKRSRPTLDIVKLRERLSNQKDNLLTKNDATELNELIKNLRFVIEAETAGKFAFVVTDKRLDTQKLLSDVKSLMPEGTFDLLPEFAQKDFEEAGKCLVFELATASAFHILRATESVLRYFYCKIVKQKRVDPLMWGPMTDALRLRRTPPPDTILNLLDHIRKSFRNPTQHPEKFYGIDEVQNLFGLCIDVVSRMMDYTKQIT